MVRVLVLAARAVGGNADGLIERYSLPTSVEQLPEVAVSVRVLRELSDEVAVLIGDPFIGLHLAGMINRGDFGLFEFILRSVSTVREGCHLTMRYSALINELTEVSFEEREDEAILTERIPGEPLGGGRQSNELTIAAVIRLFKQVIRDDWKPRRVWFSHSRDGDLSPLVSFLGTDQITFGAATNGFAIDIADLDHRIPSSDDALRAVLEAQAKAIIAQRPAKSDLLGRIREHVRLALPKGPPSLEDAATSLGMTERTLQRRLADESTTFNGVIDDVRATLATHYLADPKISLGEVAFLLGYAELSNFMRAFKRWTGTPPGTYRARH